MRPARPPRLARALLAAVVPRGPSRDGLIGDLDELYAERRTEEGGFRAGAWYWAEALLAAMRYGVRRAGRRPSPRPQRTRTHGVAGDVIASLRALRRQRSFVAVTVLTLALGIGANIAVFSVVNAVVLRSLPVAEPERVVRLHTARSDNPDAARVWSGVDLVALRESATVFSALGFFDNYRERGRDWTGDGPPQRLRVLPVNEGYFAAFGATPLLGRTFRRDEERRDIHRVVLSHGFWSTHLAARADVIGQTLLLDGIAHEVVGVLRPEFRDVIVGAVDAWLPLDTQPGGGNVRANHYLSAVARLAPGVSIGQARAQLDATFAQWREELGGKYETMTPRVVPLHEDLAGDTGRTLLILLAASGLVLLIACVNVASLFLARSAAQAGELAVRSALGASRARLVRKQMIESLVVALAGGVAGAAVGFAGVRALVSVGPAALQRTPIPMDASLLVFALGVTALTALVFGIQPALHAAAADPISFLRDGARGNTGGRRGLRLRNGVVAAQVALALVLLVGAGILMRSFSALLDIPFGFDAGDAITFEINLPGERYSDPAARALFHRSLLERLADEPSVSAAGAISWLPANGSYHGWNYDDLRQAGEEDITSVQARVVEGDIFDVLDIPIVQGRAFGAGDRAGTLPVALISRSFAGEVYGEHDPIGERFETAGDTFTIIGVTGDVAIDTRGTMPGMVHLSHTQYATDRNWSLTYVVRSSAPAESAIELARSALRAHDPSLVLHRPRRFDDVLAAHRAQDRFALLLMSVFATVAISLAAVGVYGVLTYAVQTRSREMAIRMALGARAAAVRTLVVRQALTVTGAGLVFGLAAAFALSRFLRAMVFEVSVTDPLVYGLVTLILAAVTIGAGYVPARRATRADPQTVLRGD